MRDPQLKRRHEGKRPNGKLFFSLLTAGLSLLFVFQNCSAVTSFSSGATNTAKSEASSGGGSTGGFDGKLYVHYGDCAGSTLATPKPEARLRIARDFSTAELITEGCQDLPQPQPVDVALLVFNRSASSVVIYKSRIFDQQNDGAADQRVTTVACMGITSKLELVSAAVWTSLKDPLSLSVQGDVQGASSTGVVRAQSSSSGGQTVYSNANGLGIYFSLNVAPTLMASLLFQKPPAALSSYPDLKCLNQSLPGGSVPPVAAVSATQLNGMTCVSRTATSAVKAACGLTSEVKCLAGEVAYTGGMINASNDALQTTAPIIDTGGLPIGWKISAIDTYGSASTGTCTSDAATPSGTVSGATPCFPLPFGFEMCGAATVVCCH